MLLIKVNDSSKMKDKISKEQKEFYIRNKQELIDKYFANFSNQVDPYAVRDLFAPIGYDRTNVQKFQGISKVLTRDIFNEVLIRNKRMAKKVIFASGLPATGKTMHLKKIARNELMYDGTINDERKFIDLIKTALYMGFSVEVFVYRAAIQKAFKRNLVRGDKIGRYVPISHYEKVAKTLNNRESLVRKLFNDKVNFVTSNTRILKAYKPNSHP